MVQHVAFKTEKLDNTKQLDTDTVKVNPLFNTHWCTATLTSPDQTQRSLTELTDAGSLQSLIGALLHLQVQIRHSEVLLN